MIDGFFREKVITVPDPMVDLLARKPGVSDAQVCASAERHDAFDIVVGGSVDECGANNIRPVSASVSRERVALVSDRTRVISCGDLEPATSPRSL